MTLISPVFGVHAYLGQFLESVRAQTLEDIEVILVDDGGVDGCPTLIDAFVKENPHCMAFHQPNQGVSAARNLGIQYATGDYLYFADPDDWLDPRALEFIWLAGKESQADVIFGDHIVIKDSSVQRMKVFAQPFASTRKETISAIQFAINCSGDVRISTPDFQGMKNVGAAPWRCAFKRSLIAENGLCFDSSLRTIGEDLLFYLNVFEYATKATYTPQVFCNHRRLSSSLSKGYKVNFLSLVTSVLEKEREFIAVHDKGDFFVGSYYLRTMLYLYQSMTRYFLNPVNPACEQERYEEFCEFCLREPIHTAIMEAPIQYLGSRSQRIAVWLLRFGHEKLFWVLCKHFL